MLNLGLGVPSTILMCLCVYIYMYVCICTYKDTNIYIYRYISNSSLIITSLSLHRKLQEWTKATQKVKEDLDRNQELQKLRKRLSALCLKIRLQYWNKYKGKIIFVCMCVLKKKYFFSPGLLLKFLWMPYWRCVCTVFLLFSF